MCDMSYKLIVENYGKIEKAELEVAPLTLFVGDNNSGKSYLLSLLWALFSGEENGILYRGMDELLEKKFPQFYSGFMDILADDEVDGKYIVTDEQELLRIMNELFLMNKDDFVRSIFNYEGMSIGKIELKKGTNHHYKIKSEKMEEGRREIRVFCDEKPGWQMGFSFLTKEKMEKFIIDRVVRQMTMFLLDSGRSRNSSFYLPAARTGFMLAKNTINQVGRKRAFDWEIILDEEHKTADVSPFPKSIIHFWDAMDNLNLENEKEIYKKLIDWINDNMTNGNIECVDHNSGNIQYIPNGMESGIPLRATSGVVTELTPLILLLKYARHLREICYEEPEMCLHPQLQYQMARLIIRMVNSKINIVASTHSDIIIQHINNMCQMCGADADDKTLERMGLDREDLISVDKIAVYQFKGNAGKTRVERILPEDNTFKVPSFMDALKNILNKTIAVSDIVYGEDD